MTRLHLGHALSIMLTLATSGLAQSAAERAAWNQQVRPFRILDDVYYVGTRELGCYLITTSRGLILLDGALPESAPQIAANIRALGFRLKDVRFLLNTHAHLDHCGGLAELKRETGAQLVMSAADADVEERGATDTGPTVGMPFPAAHVDRRIGHGATVRLGHTVLTAHITPGHTRGCTTWTMSARDHGRPVQVVFFGSITVAGNRLFDNPTYPGIQQDYRLGFARLRSLPCDVFLGPHTSFFNLEKKIELLGKSSTNPFVDPGEYALTLRRFELQYYRERWRQNSRRRTAR